MSIYIPLKNGFYFRKKVREGKERNINRLPPAHLLLGTEPITQACALAGNRTGELSGHRMMLNQLSHTS